jgi:hypothetical protein
MSLAIKLRQFMGVIVCEHKGFIGNDTGLRDGAGSETEVRYIQEDDEEDDVGGGGDERDNGGCEVGEGECGSGEGRESGEWGGGRLGGCCHSCLEEVSWSRMMMIEDFERAGATSNLTDWGRSAAHGPPDLSIFSAISTV